MDAIYHFSFCPIDKSYFHTKSLYYCTGLKCHKSGIFSISMLAWKFMPSANGDARIGATRHRISVAGWKPNPDCSMQPHPAGSCYTPIVLCVAFIIEY